MVNELIQAIKQAYRDIESGKVELAQSAARTADLTPQALTEVAPEAPVAPQEPVGPGSVAPAQAPAPRPSLLDILAAQR